MWQPQARIVYQNQNTYAAYSPIEALSAVNLFWTLYNFLYVRCTFRRCMRAPFAVSRHVTILGSVHDRRLQPATCLALHCITQYMYFHFIILVQRFQHRRLRDVIKFIFEFLVSGGRVKLWFRQYRFLPLQWIAFKILSLLLTINQRHMLITQWRVPGINHSFPKNIYSAIKSCRQ